MIVFLSNDVVSLSNASELLDTNEDSMLSAALLALYHGAAAILSMISQSINS